MNKQIAKVKSTMLGIEDHGIFTAMLDVDYGDSGQGIGGYSLDEPVNRDGIFAGRRGTAYGLEWIRRAIDACGVSKWEDIKGRTILVYRESEAWGARIIGFGPLPTEKGTPFIFADLSVDEEVSS